MTKEEAIEWIEGRFSSVNVVPQEPFETWEYRIEQMDTLKIQQAYYILQYYKELKNEHR